MKLQPKTTAAQEANVGTGNGGRTPAEVYRLRNASARVHHRNAAFLAALVVFVSLGCAAEYVLYSSPLIAGSQFAGVLGIVLLPVSVSPWLQVAVVATVGMAVNRLFSGAYHIYATKDFDTGAIGYHVALVIQSPFIVLGFFGLGGVLLPLALNVPGIPLPVSRLTLGLALFLGYFSDNLLQPLHNKFLRLLGFSPEDRAPVRADVPGASLPLIGLVRQDVARVVGTDAKVLAEVVAQLGRRGILTTQDLIGLRTARARVARVAEEVGVNPDVLHRLACISDVARVVPDPSTAADLVRRGVVTAQGVVDHVEAVPSTGRETTKNLLDLLGA